MRVLDANLPLNNFLIRGDYPGKGKATRDTESPNLQWVIDYDYWKEEILNLLEIQKRVKLDDIFIVDITLLRENSTTEDEKMVKAELDYFEKNPDHGRVVHHQINGTLLNATQMSQKERNKYLAEYEKFDDKLPEIVDYAHTTINTDWKIPTVVYWHCATGVDRTGETSGAYQMKYHGWNFKRAYDCNTDVGGRHMESNVGRMMNWQCFWLEWKKIQKDLDCDVW